MANCTWLYYAFVRTYALTPIIWKDGLYIPRTEGKCLIEYGLKRWSQMCDVVWQAFGEVLAVHFAYSVLILVSGIRHLVSGDTLENFIDQRHILAQGGC